MKKSYRPGVYSQYDIISKPKSYEQRYAFFCGGSKVKEEKSIPANTVVQLHSVEELKEYFLEEGSGKVFCSIARMLLESGISGLYVVPITTDGSTPAAEDYAAAVQKLCEIKKSGIILCDSSEQSVLQVLKDKTQEASQNQRERVAVAAVPKSNAKSVAQSLNSERMVLCCQESGSSFAGEEKSVLFSAAAVAAMLAVSQPDDRFYSRKMEGLVSTEQLEESEIETLLQSGVTVLEEVESEVVCIRCVTTRTQTGGEEDRTFVSINTVLMIDDIIRAVRVQMSALLKDSRIGFSENSIASQVAVILDEKVQQGFVTEFEPPVVYASEEDPTVCVVELEFHLASVPSQIYLTAHISI